MKRRLWPLAALLATALVVTGCSNETASNTDANGNEVAGGVTSSTSVNGTSSSGSTTKHDQALAFSACMRSNGVKNFPDPNSSGELTVEIVNGSSIDVESAAWNKALGACKNLQPAGFMGSKRTPEQQQSALQFADCVRDNGVKNFPDPRPDGPLIDVDAPSMPGLHVAMKKCHDFATAAGVKGP